ncbi:hypothetical protein EDB81DRAFT_330382 [Dactylonectria macrodidyma]|uniref:Secreted protein n=1 Tax=Dactylonectria macrodidyma TaxID=307937 RepID=A0A9P9FG69_9HYPO|nr:hypothetical protein EDB81DRAFT_330382 [Dactylonectria macrodidyma]
MAWRFLWNALFWTCRFFIICVNGEDEFRRLNMGSALFLYALFHTCNFFFFHEVSFSPAAVVSVRKNSTTPFSSVAWPPTGRVCSSPRHPAMRHIVRTFKTLDSLTGG